MDLAQGGYSDWLKSWLKDLSNNGNLADERIDDPFLVDFSRHSSIAEAALEVYNGLRSADLSLDQLNAYINKLGTIISQTDLRAIATLPRSQMARVFAVIFTQADIAAVFADATTKNPHACVYLLIRVLFEVVLYTPSTPVRSSAHSQIMRNRETIDALIRLAYNATGARLNKHAGADNSGPAAGNYHLPYDPRNTSTPAPDKHANPVGEVGFPSSRFSQNIFETLLLDMMHSPETNLCATGVQLLTVVPTVAAKSPRILSQLCLLLVGDDDELSHMAGIALADALPLTPELVALNMLKASYSNALSNALNAQRVKTFTLVALACREFAGITKYAYRMIWSVYLALARHDKLSALAHSVVTELKIGLAVASTMVAVKSPANAERQLQRLEALTLQYLNTLTKADTTNAERNRTQLLLIRGLLYALFMLHFAQETTWDALSKLRDLTNITVNNTLNLNKYVNIDKLTRGVDPLRERKNEFYSFVYHGTCLKFLDFFAKNPTQAVFNQFLELFQEAMQYGPSNVNALFAAKTRLRLVEQPCTALLRLFAAVQAHIGKLDEALRVRVLVALLEMVEFAFLTDHQNFGGFMTKFNEAATNPQFKLLTRPLLQVQNINHESMLAEQDILVHHLYSTVNDVVTESFATRPVVLDFATGTAYSGRQSLTVLVAKPKLSWGAEYAKILRKQIALNFAANTKRPERPSSYAELYRVAVFCLRLGFYEEAAGILRKLVAVSEHHYFWLRTLLKFAECNLVRREAKAARGDLTAYFAEYAANANSLLALLRVLRTTNARRAALEARALWDHGLNRLTPEPMLHSLFTLTLCTKVGIGDLMTAIRDKNYEVGRFVTLFGSLKAAFRALELAFARKSRETVYVLSFYQGVAAVVLHLLRSLEAAQGRDTRVGPEDCGYFWKYIAAFSPNLEMPAVLDMIDALPARRKRALLANVFATQKMMVKGKGKAETAAPAKATDRAKVVVENASLRMHYAPEGAQVGLDTIWNELVGSLRLTTRAGHVHAFRRDVPAFNEVYKHLQPLTQSRPRNNAGYSDSKFVAFLEAVVLAEVPTPVGALKAFPLPFASLTATLLTQVRTTDAQKSLEPDVQTLAVQGTLKNCRVRGAHAQDAKLITRIALKMDFGEHTAGPLRKTLKLNAGAVSETLLVKVPREVCMRGTLIAVPVDAKSIPRGAPAPVLLTEKHM